MIHRFVASSVLFACVQVCAPQAWAVTAPTTNADGEVIPADEAQSTAAMVSGIRALVQSGFDANGHAFRDAHRKAHGCVQSTFTVLPNLPPAVAQGLFATPRSYNAVIRYSNGSGQSQDDHTVTRAAWPSR